jgi:NADP-dependent 3-hydroxy acid dehydrogenase YdfG
MSTDTPQLQGKHVLISGGTTGIGRAIAIDLVRQGCEVIVFGRHKKELDDALLDMQKVGNTGDGLVADQANLEEVRRVMQHVAAKWGNLDYLINNAAIGADSLLEDDESTWEYVARSNLVGYLLCSRYAVERMSKGGHIINIGSISAERRKPGGEIYTATKAGIRAFSESLRKGVEERGIKVSLIEPGRTGSDIQEMTREELEEQQSADKMMIAEDIAACVRFCLTMPSRANVSMMQVLPRVNEGEK